MVNPLWHWSLFDLCIFRRFESGPSEVLERVFLLQYVRAAASLSLHQPHLSHQAICVHVMLYWKRLLDFLSWIHVEKLSLVT